MLLRPRLASRLVELLESNGIAASWRDGTLTVDGAGVEAVQGPDGQLRLEWREIPRRVLAILMAAGAETSSPGWVQCGLASEEAVVAALRALGHATIVDASAGWTRGTVGEPRACVHFELARVPSREGELAVVVLSSESSIEHSELAARVIDGVEAALEALGVTRTHRTRTVAQRFVPTALRVEAADGVHLVELDGDRRLWIGREDCCELRPAGQHVAQRHAEIHGQVPGRFWLSPLSDAPVLLNGRRCWRTVMLWHGDVIECGSVRFQVQELRSDGESDTMRRMLDALDEAPRDERRWSAFEDWLLERGDPLGAWMQDAISNDVPLGFSARLRHGFVSAAHVWLDDRDRQGGLETSNLVEGFVAQPLSRFASSLTIDLDDANDLQRCLDLLDQATHLRHLARVTVNCPGGLHPGGAHRFELDVVSAAE